MPFRYDPRPAFDARVAVHGVLTGVLLGIGIILLLPNNTFATAEGWRLFAQSATEDTWGIILLVGALFGAVGLVARYRWIHVLSVLLLATFHVALGALFILGNPVGAGSILAGGYALLGYYLAWRLVPWRRIS